MRLTFLSWFVLNLAIAAGAFFAWTAGIPQLVWAGDLSHATSVIAALFVGSAAWLGWQSWKADGPLVWLEHRRKPQSTADASYGHLAERLCVMLGLAGTTIGLSLQGKALMSGGASFGALSTSLFTTATGIVAAGLLAVLVFNLEAGLRRSAR